MQIKDFFLAILGQWYFGAFVNIFEEIKWDYDMYVLQSHMNRWTNLHQILYRPLHNLKEDWYYIYDPANPSPAPGPPKLQNLSRFFGKKLRVTKNAQMGDLIVFC